MQGSTLRSLIDVLGHRLSESAADEDEDEDDERSGVSVQRATRSAALSERLARVVTPRAVVVHAAERHEAGEGGVAATDEPFARAALAREEGEEEEEQGEKEGEEDEGEEEQIWQQQQQQPQQQQVDDVAEDEGHGEHEWAGTPGEPMEDAAAAESFSLSEEEAEPRVDEDDDRPIDGEAGSMIPSTR